MQSLTKYKELIKKNKYLLIVLCVGVVLLLLPSGKPEKVSAEPTALPEFSIEEYESKIEKSLLKCEGVGRVDVVLSVSGTGESIYATEKSVNNQKRDSDYTKDSDTKLSVLSTGSGTEAPVTIRQMYPEFLGALVVCDGADISRVRVDITNAIMSLTGLSSDKITIVKMKN